MTDWAVGFLKAYQSEATNTEIDSTVLPIEGSENDATRVFNRSLSETGKRDVARKDLFRISCSHGGLLLVPHHLDGAVGIQKQVLAADAAVDAAQGHVEAEAEEVAMVEMSHTVVQPGWEHVEFKSELKMENLRTSHYIFRLLLKGYDSGGPSLKRTCDMRDRFIHDL